MRGNDTSPALRGAFLPMPFLVNGFTLFLTSDKGGYRNLRGKSGVISVVDGLFLRGGNLAADVCDR